MSNHQHSASRLRVRWSAIGAAIAISLGAGGLSMAHAAVSTDDKPVTVTVEPTRILDTRENIGLPGRFADATPREIQVTGSVSVASGGTDVVVPPDAVGVIVNATVVNPSAKGFLSIRPGGASGSPTTSNVNFLAGVNTPNAATVDLSADGRLQLWLETGVDGGNAHVVLDIVGYTVDHDHDDRYHTKGQVDAALAGKANTSDIYTRTQIDPILNDKVTNDQLDDGVTFLETKINDNAGIAYAGGASRTLTTVGSFETMASLPFSTAIAGHIVATGTANITTFTAGINSNCRLVLDGFAAVSQNTTTVGDNGYANTFGAAVGAGQHVVELECRQNNGVAEVGVFAPWISLTFSGIQL